MIRNGGGSASRGRKSICRAVSNLRINEIRGLVATFKRRRQEIDVRGRNRDSSVQLNLK
jgi:hypothetical protein